MRNSRNIKIKNFDVAIGEVQKHETAEYIAGRFQQAMDETLHKFYNREQVFEALYSGSNTNQSQNTNIDQPSATQEQKGSTKSSDRSEKTKTSSAQSSSAPTASVTSSASQTSSPQQENTQENSNTQTSVSDSATTSSTPTSISQTTDSTNASPTTNTNTAVNTGTASTPNTTLSTVAITPIDLITVIDNQYLDPKGQHYNEADVVFWEGKKAVLQKLNTKDITSWIAKPENEKVKAIYAKLVQERVKKGAKEILAVPNLRIKLINEIENNLLKQSSADNYWEFLLKKLKNNAANLEELFYDHNELFLLLQTILGVTQLPDNFEIYVATPSIALHLNNNKNIYASLSPQIIYPKLKKLKLEKVDGAYQILQELEEIHISLIGEVPGNENGKKPALLEGQWYKEDRLDNPENPNSSFWKAAVINTENNNAKLYRSIAQRHAYYKFADAYLKSKGIISEWFDAAAHVTMNSPFTAEVTLGGAQGGTLASTFISGTTEDFLRGGNAFLLKHNMQNVQLLIEGKGTIDLDFTDANGNLQSFKGLTQEALDFKLVEFEQSLVQKYLAGYIEKLDPNTVTDNLLERYLIEKDTPRENLQDIIDEINGLFKGELTFEGKRFMGGLGFISEDITEEIIQKYFTVNGKITFDFSDYKKRVALGSAMVEELYYHRYRDTLSNRLEKINKNPKLHSVESPEKFKEYINRNVPKSNLEVSSLYELIDDDLSLSRIHKWKVLRLNDVIELIKNDYERLKRIETNIEDPEIFNYDFISQKLDETHKAIIESWNKTNPKALEELENLHKELIYDLEAFKKSSVKALEGIEELPNDIVEDIKNDIRRVLEDKTEAIDTVRYTQKRINAIRDIYDNGVDLYEKKTSQLKQLKEKYLSQEKLKQIGYETTSTMFQKIALEIYPDLYSIVRNKNNTEDKKVNLFETNANATAAILLYEFLHGEGKTTRKFYYNKHPFARAILQGRVLDEIVKETVDILERDRYDFKNMHESEVYRLSLEFSPRMPKNILEPNKREIIKLLYSLIESGDKHLNSNWQQLFLGGALVDIYIKSGILHGKIFNKTGKESLAFHLDENDDSKVDKNINKRPKMASIYQEIYFSFKLP